MNRHQLTSIAVAMACFLAVGVAATTLSSTVSSNPAEAVDLNYRYLPIESSDVAKLNNQINRHKHDPSQHADDPAQRGGRGQDGRGSGPDQPDQPQREMKPKRGDSSNPGGLRGQQHDQKGLTPGDGSHEMAGKGKGNSKQPAPKEVDSGSLLWLAVGLLVAGLLLALAYRYRDRLLAFFGSSSSVESEDETDAGWKPSPPGEKNVVFTAWNTLLRNLDVEDTAARTTTECATAAANAGMDRDAIETLTQTFEEVRYGKRPVTDDRRQRVSQVCQRLQLDLPEGGA